MDYDTFQIKPKTQFDFLHASLTLVVGHWYHIFIVSMALKILDVTIKVD